MSAIRSVFKHLGYVVREIVLDGWDFGVLEHRKRLVVIATTPGFADTFSFDNLKVTRVRESCINEILDPIPLDDESWKTYEYLAEKEKRDKEAGKGFERQLLTGQEDGCGTLGAIMVSSKMLRCGTRLNAERFSRRTHDVVVSSPMLQFYRFLLFSHGDILSFIDLADGTGRPATAAL